MKSVTVQLDLINHIRYSQRETCQLLVCVCGFPSVGNVFHLLSLFVCSCLSICVCVNVGVCMNVCEWVFLYHENIL